MEYNHIEAKTYHGRTRGLGDVLKDEASLEITKRLRVDETCRHSALAEWMNRHFMNSYNRVKLQECNQAAQGEIWHSKMHRHGRNVCTVVTEANFLDVFGRKTGGRS